MDIKNKIVKDGVMFYQSDNTEIAFFNSVTGKIKYIQDEIPYITNVNILDWINSYISAIAIKR